MAADVGVRVKVEGEKTFTQAIRTINQQMKELDAEMKAAVSSMDGMQKGETQTAQKTRILTESIAKAQEKVSLLSQQYDKAKSNLSSLGAAQEEAKSKLDAYGNELTEAKAKLDTLGAELDQLKNAEGDHSAEIQEVTQAYEAQKAVVDQAQQNYINQNKEVTKATNAYNKEEAEIAKLGTQINTTNATINKHRAELEKTTSSLYKAGEAAKKWGERLSKAGQTMSKIGTSMTKYITTPILAAGTASVKFASDYNENLNKVDASFKDSADVVKEWAKTATESFGLSENSALEATSLFGDMGTSMGLTTEQAAEMAISLTGLAGDLSSFKNIGIDQAMTALKGVFTGETESIKELGVVMTETNLKEFADGLGLVYDEMSQAEKVTLRYQYVLEKTENSQGDYIRTSDEAANSLRTMKAEAENLGVAFGEELLPTITPLIQDATELIRKFGEMDESTKQNIIQAGLFVAAAGPVITVFGKLTGGISNLVTAAGTASTALSGGAGLGSAILSALGTNGKVGLAIAGVAALSGGIYALVTNIRDAHDPVLQLQNAIDGVNTAQESLSTSQNIIDLATRYEELRAKMSDTSLSASELSSVESELDGVRSQLSSATGGAVSTEGDYNSELDQTVAIQKTLAEIEKDRAKTEIYDYLIEGSNDYKYALEELEQAESDLEAAQEQRDISAKAYAEGTDETYQGLLDTVEEIQGKLDEGLIDTSTVEGAEMMRESLDMLEDSVNALRTDGEEIRFDNFAEAASYIENMDYSTQDAADSLEEAEGQITELDGKIKELSDQTSSYDKVLLNLVDSGLVSADEIAGILEISVEDLEERLDECRNTTDDSANSTEDLGDAADGTADKLDEEAQAAEESADAIMDVARAAVEARYSGGDLREAYEELSSELEGLREEGDQELIQLAEEQLALLDHAATVQELATSYAELGITSTGSLSDMATFLISTGTSVDEFASNVSSMRDSVVNSFQKIVDENSITASQMGSALSANLGTMKQWGNDVKALWDQAYAEQDFAVMNYINYLAQTGGPEYAAAMREFASGGYEELKAQAYQWEELGGLSVQYEANGMWANQYLAEQAASDVGYGAIDSYMGSYNSADTQSMGSESVERTIDGMKSQTSAVKTSAQQQTDAITTIWTNAAPGFQSIGFSATQSIAGGLSSGQPYVTSAANLLAQAAKDSAGSISFYSVGYNMAQGIANGLYGGSSLIESAAISVARSALSSAKAELGIHSPSRVFRDEVGEMMGEGMALGLEDSMRRIEQAARLVSNNAYGAVARNMALSNAGSNMTNRQYTVSPTIYVYGAPGQDENVLAEKIMAKINTSLIRRSMS